MPDFSAALDLAMAALKAAGERELTAENVESAVLDRTRGRRKFRRVTDEELHAQF
jgi:20S proteasome alpha/beta subunit